MFPNFCRHTSSVVTHLLSSHTTNCAHAAHRNIPDPAHCLLSCQALLLCPPFSCLGCLPLPAATLAPFLSSAARRPVKAACTIHTLSTTARIFCLCTRSVCLAAFVIYAIHSPHFMRTPANKYYTKAHKNTFQSALFTRSQPRCASFVFARHRFVSQLLSYTRSIRRILCALWPMSTTPRHTKTLSQVHLHSHAVSHAAHLLSLHKVGLSRSFCHIRDPFAVSYAHSGQ